MGVITADSYGKTEEKKETKRRKLEETDLPHGYEIKYGMIVPISIMRRFTPHAKSETPIPVFKEVMTKRGESWQGKSGYWFSKQWGLESTFGEIKEKTITRLANKDMSMEEKLRSLTEERLGIKRAKTTDVIDWVRTWKEEDVVDMTWMWS